MTSEEIQRMFDQAAKKHAREDRRLPLTDRGWKVAGWCGALGLVTMMGLAEMLAGSVG